MYRSIGRRNANGSFEPNITFSEVLFELPEEMTTVFFELDRVYGKMERQYIKQTAGKGSGA